MTLKDTISKWHAATCLMEQGQHIEAVQRLKEIQNPSAKIVYNLGCIAMYMELYNDAIEYFNSSLKQDQYLAISYFQRGVCHFRMNSYPLAEKDFVAARSMLSEEGIDYRQLGAKIILQSHMIDGYSRSCRHHGHNNMPSPTQASLMDIVFYPPKKMVANLKKEDFLGKAKVISSVKESDIVYAEQKFSQDLLRKKNSPGTGRNMSSLSSALSTLPRFSSTLNLKRPPIRPPPRLGRSRSLGDLLEDEDRVDGSLPSGNVLTVPKHEDHFHKSQSCSDYDISNTTYPSNEPSHIYEPFGKTRLSSSSSALDRPNIKVRPLVPKRPIVKAKPTGASQSLQQNVEFHKLQETLKEKFANFGANKDNEKLLFQTARHSTDKLGPFKANSNVSQVTGGKSPPMASSANAHPSLWNPVTKKGHHREALRNVQSCSSSLPNRPQIQTTTTRKPPDISPKPARPQKPPKPSRPPPPRSGK